MSERDILLRWLDRAAARVRVGLRLRHAVTLVCALLALLALHEGLRALIPAPEVLAALLPLFLLAATGAATVCVVRLWSPATLMQTAAAADARAGLKDELRSALWFTQAIDGGPLVGPLLAHASRTVQALDASRLFPLTVPRHVLAALGLTLLALALTQFLPLTSFPAGKAGPAPPLTPESSALPPQGRDVSRAAQDPIPGAPSSARAQAAWSQLQELAAALAGEAEGQAIGQGDRRARCPARGAVAASVAGPPGGAAHSGRAARPRNRADVGHTRRRHSRATEGSHAGAGSAVRWRRRSADAPTAQLTEELRADSPPEKGDPAGQQSAGERVLNDMLRAINRSSIGRRDVAGGAGEAAQDAGRANVGGGAMGRRVGSEPGRRAATASTAQAMPDGNAETEPVLGREDAAAGSAAAKGEGGREPIEDRPARRRRAVRGVRRAQAAGLEYEAVAHARGRPPRNSGGRRAHAAHLSGCGETIHARPARS